MREAWLRSQAHKREALSLTITAIAYAAVFCLVLIIEGGRVETISDFSGPLMVSLGSPEGAEKGSLVMAPEPSMPTEAPAPTQTPPSETPPAETATATTALPPPPTAPPKTPAAPVANTKPAPAAPPSPPAPASAAPSSPSAPVAAAAPAAGAVGPAAGSPALARGSEAGNDYETSFGGSSDLVGRAIYVPIYRYMPPPLYVDQSIVDRLSSAPGAKSAMSPEERKRIFAAYYAKTSLGWMLKEPVAFREREALWLALEDAGYNPARADFKTGKDLKPVVLEFTVTPMSESAMPTLEDLHVVESSGYTDLDEAVLYGFRQAAFRSTADRPVKGRFVYRFK